MKSERSIIPAAPGWFILGYISGLEPDQTDAGLWREPIIAWEIERCVHEASVTDRYPIPWHEVTGIGVDGNHLNGSMIAYLSPNGTVAIQAVQDFEHSDALLEYWKKEWIADHKQKAAQ